MHEIYFVCIRPSVVGRHENLQTRQVSENCGRPNNKYLIIHILDWLPWVLKNPRAFLESSYNAFDLWIIYFRLVYFYFLSRSCLVFIYHQFLFLIRRFVSVFIPPILWINLFCSVHDACYAYNTVWLNRCKSEVFVLCTYHSFSSV